MKKYVHPRQVLVNPATGLTHEDCVKAEEMLK